MNNKPSFYIKLFKAFCVFIVSYHAASLFLWPILQKFFQFLHPIKNPFFSILVAITLLLLLLFQNKTILWIQLFLIALFVSAVLAFNQGLNFTFHVILIAILSRIYLRIIRINKTNIQDHLINDV